MSLINDALKRTKQVQQQQEQTTPSLHAAPLHVAPAPLSSRMWPIAVVALALAVIMTGVAIWYSVRGQPVSARAKIEPATPVAVNNQPVVETPAQPTVPLKAQTSLPLPVPAALNEVTSAPASPVIASPVSEPPPGQVVFPSLRLQGVLYNPKNPAAIINGRTLFVGDTISGARLTAITPDKATVVWNDTTNVLSLPN